MTVHDAVNGMIDHHRRNDAATAMGEALGGLESGFARIMTQKARATGTRWTVIHQSVGSAGSNAQATTARETSRRSRLRSPTTIPKRIPAAFHNRASSLSRQPHSWLQHPMYRYEGMDGIKTGYTRRRRPSTSSALACQGNRRVIGAVMGGATARSRDDKMASLLLTRYALQASSVGRSRLVAKSPEKPARRQGAGRKWLSASDEADIPIPTAWHSMPIP